MQIKNKAISGVKWTTISTATTAIVQLLQISILARYLSPSAFGTVAIITLIIGFSQMFVDMGISSAIIHKQNVTQKQLSTLYWLNVLSSIIIYIIILISSPFIADFYNNNTLSELINLTSSVVVIQSFGKQYFVLFEKKLQFDVIAKIDILASILSLVLAIILAILKFDIYSLIYPLIFNTIIKSVLYIYKGQKFHKPVFYFEIKDVKEFVIFGLYQMGSGIVNYLNSQFDIIIIGKVFGSETLGVYSITKQFVMRPAQIINPVVTRVTFPTMSKVQNDYISLKNIYLKTINYLSSINFPVYITMIILAPELINVFLGEKWNKAIVIFQILSVYALFRSTGNPIGSLILAKGKPQYEFFWNLAKFLYLPLLILFLSQFGILIVLMGLVVHEIIIMIPNWYFLVKKLCFANFQEYFIQIFKPLFIAVASGAVSFLTLKIFKIDFMIFNILLVVTIEILGLLLLNNILNKDFVDTLRIMVKK